MALFGRDYDRDYGAWGSSQNRNDRGFMGRWGWGGGDRDYGAYGGNNEYRGRVAGSYDAGYFGNSGYRGGSMGYDAGYRNDTGYRNDMGYRGGAAGYDNNYKSRWETDYGDPFGDRTAHTPMRMIRGNYRSDYDRNYMAEDRGRNMGGGWNRNDMYDRDYYASNPMSYEPYGRTGWNRYDNGMRNNRGNERGWF